MVTLLSVPASPKSARPVAYRRGWACAFLGAIALIASSVELTAAGPGPGKGSSPYAELQELLGGDVALYTKGAPRLEYCPDNTCDAFTGRATAAEDLATFAHAYILWVSDYYALSDLRLSARGKEARSIAVQRAAAEGCRGGESAAISCLLERLSTRGGVKVSMVRYDENRRIAVPVDLSRELKRFREESKESK